MIPKKQQCATVLNLENKGIVVLMQISEYRIFFLGKVLFLLKIVTKLAICDIMIY